MITNWDILDEVAEREAKALARAKRHRSVFQRHRKGGGVNRMEQCVFDEHLTTHSMSCYYCGRSLEHDIPSERRQVDNQFIDICLPCMFLHGLVESIQARHERRQHGGACNGNRRKSRDLVRL